MKAHTKETQDSITPLSALEILKEGNNTFNVTFDHNLCPIIANL